MNRKPLYRPVAATVAGQNVPDKMLLDMMFPAIMFPDKMFPAIIKGVSPLCGIGLAKASSVTSLWLSLG